MRPLLATVLVLAGCQGPGYSDSVTPPGTDPEVTDPTMPDPMSDPTMETPDDGYADVPDWSADLDEEWAERLAQRELDYGSALRVASLRLRGDLPSLAEIRGMQAAPDKRVAYEELIDSFLSDPRFTVMLLRFWRDTLKMGGNGLDTAPLFATKLGIENADMSALFTATSGTCPTFDGATSTITAADCMNNVPTHAGILSNPDVMRHFFSNIGFRRVRWLQETFACSAFPAEFRAEPADVGGPGPYTAPWPFESIAGESNGGRVDFLDTESVICANCHATMNHLAPLVARFDAEGMWTGDFAVPLPLEGAPLVQMSDYLVPGETTAWRIDAPAEDLPALGRAIADDRDVAQCTVARVWNWALGKGDIVLTRTAIPQSVVEPFVEDYVGGGHRFRDLVFAIYTSDDFVRF
jgi:hypothetical protein